jgi:capsular polysaccharide biosynthesis protein
MNQQSLSLRRSVQIIRRYKLLVAAAMLLGILGGVGYAVMHPPKMSSRALVVVTKPKPNMATDLLIAGSQPVLSGASPSLGSAVSLKDLTDSVTVGTVTPSVLSIDASAKTAALAVKEANAVANSFITYIGSANSPVGPVSAQILVAASSATGAGHLSTMIIDGIFGLVAGLAVGFVVALRVSRGDKRLWERDAIAASIGVPVMAAVPVTLPDDAAGWLKLVDEYKPAPVSAWRLRAILDHLGVTGPGVNGALVTLTVVSVSTDRKAFVLGPQLAAFAASLGVPTGLLASPQDLAATATLRAACTQPSPMPLQGGWLRVAVDGGGNVEQQLDAKFTVVVTAVDATDKATTAADAGNPVHEKLRTPVTMLAVSAGGATGDQLAQAAAVAANSGSIVAGIIVADPDPNDDTTGLAPRPVGRFRRAVPTKQVDAREVRAGDRTRSADWAARSSR